MKIKKVQWIVSVITLLALFASPFAFPQPTQAVSPNIVISQVYGGGGNSGATYTHDFVELFNRGSTPVSVNGWSIQYASATGTGNFGSSATMITPLPNITLQPGQYLLIQEAQGSGGTTPLPAPDVTDSSPIAMSATGGKVALASISTSLGCNGSSTPCSPAQMANIVDLVGWDGANFYEGSGPAPATTNTTAIFRNNGGCVDTDNNASDFTAAAPTPRNTASPLNVCPLSTNPSGAGLATPNAVFPGDATLLTVAVTPGTNPTSTGLTVTGDLSLIGGSASQPFFDDGTNGDVTAGDLVFSYQATVSTTTSPASLILPATITDAQTRTGSATISLTVRPPLVAIHDIQGASHISPKNGLLVSTRGIVTAKTNNGFYIQDPYPDSDEATSEAIFFYSGSAPGVTIGDQVLVTGTVKEYRPGGSSTINLTTTELDNPGRSVTVESSGNPLPPPAVIGLGGRLPPTTIIEDDASNVENSGTFDPANDGIDFYESMEAMRVQVNNARVVGPTNAYGEIPVVGDNGANASLLTPRGGIVIQPGDFNPERIILDDIMMTTPLVDVGTRFTAPIIGVLDYNFGNFKLEVTDPLTYTSAGLIKEVTLAGQPYQLSVASMNLENLDPNDPQIKFDTLAGEIVNNLLAPDLIGLQEVQDNNGAIDNGVLDADQTYAKLIAAIQAAGGPVYQYRQINPLDNSDGGEPGGNIRVGFLFRTDRGLSFIDRPGGDATTGTSVVAGISGPELTLSPGRIDPTNDAFLDSRKPLAGEFLFKGDKVFVVVNHFNSKGGDDPLFGYRQPPILSSETQRLQQAQVVNDFVDSLLALDPNANVVLLGDLNDFQFSNPLAVLSGGVLNDLVTTLPLEEQYTYVYDGNSQVLDHILIGNATFSRPFSYDVVHVNAEYALNFSDHDPEVANLCVDATPPTLQVTVTPDVLWPANHKYVNVTATVNYSDNADSNPTLALVGVTSNEPDNGLGDGDMPNDIVIVDDFHFKLRAERSGTGNGRVYSISYRALDGCGNATTLTAIVFVPHDQGQPKPPTPPAVYTSLAFDLVAAYPYHTFLPSVRR